VPDGYPAMKEHRLKRPALAMELLMALAQPRCRHIRLVRSPDLALLPRLKGVRHREQREVVKKVTFTLLLIRPVPFSPAT
jgi:hypothetical protein